MAPLHACVALLQGQADGGAPQDAAPRGGGAPRAPGCQATLSAAQLYLGLAAAEARCVPAEVVAPLLAKGLQVNPNPDPNPNPNP